MTAGLDWTLKFNLRFFLLKYFKLYFLKLMYPRVKSLVANVIGFD